MLTNEQRAHDLAISMINPTIEAMLKEGSSMRVPQTEVYLMLYESYLSELNKRSNK